MTIPQNIKSPVWIHLNLTDKRSITWLEKQKDINEWVLEKLVDPDVSEPRTRLRQDSVLLVLRSVKMCKKAEPDDLVLLRLLATKSKLISTSFSQAIDFKEMDEIFEDNDGPKNTSELVLAILENTLDGVSDSLSGIEDQIDALEENIIGDNIPCNAYQQLSERLRQVIIIRRFMVPEREAIGNLIRHGATWFEPETERGLRDNLDWVQRIIEDIDLLEKRIRINQDALKNKDDKKVQQNMYMLSVLAGIFLPLSFLSGVFGMNLPGIPLGNHPYGFLIVSLIMVLIGVIVLFIFKKVKWI